MSQVAEVTDATFDDVVLRSGKPVLVDYWADWCGPCRQLSPIIDELADAHSDKITFVKLDTNSNPITPTNQHVQGLPTLHVFVNGEVVKSLKGARSKAALLKVLDEYL